MTTLRKYEPDDEYGPLYDRLDKATAKADTAEKVAKAMHRVLRKFAAEIGQKPDIEVFIRAPGEPRHYNDATCWCVCWEAGPYDWAVGYSMRFRNGLVEPLLRLRSLHLSHGNL